MSAGTKSKKYSAETMGEGGLKTRAKKSLGQNFLMHASIAERIVSSAGVSERDTVLEIGPGKGMLTKPLLASAKKVIAVEADATLIPILQERFASEIANGKFVLIHADIRTFDPASIGEPYKLVANIPYYITGEIMRMFLETARKPESMTVLVQKEVMVRIVRAQKESLLSLSVKAYGLPKFYFDVPRGAFLPAPNVDSAVLGITNIQSPFASLIEENRFFQILHSAFAHKRKFLIRNLETITSPVELKRAFAIAGVSEKARAEDLSLPIWQKLAQLLKTPVSNTHLQ